MAIEAIKSAAMAYQGSASVAANNSVKPITKNENEPKVSEAFFTEEPDVEEARKNFKVLDPTEQPNKQETGSSGLNSKQLQEAVEKFKKSMLEQTEAVFGIHEGTNRVTIKIVDKDTKDVLKEYPPEQTLDMIQKVWEMAGILVDEKK